jgi:CHAT domain-containing protein
MHTLKVGMKHTEDWEIFKDRNTQRGKYRGFANWSTRLMESTASGLVDKHLKPHQRKVDVSFTARHMRPTPIGKKVLAQKISTFVTPTCGGFVNCIWNGLLVILTSIVMTYHAGAQTPPRTVSDIFAMLEQQPFSSASVTRASETLSRTPPVEGASRDTQVEFHTARAGAAASLGNIAIVIDERRKLVALTEGNRNQPKHLIDLAVTEMTAGNWSQAEQMVRRAVNSPSAWWGQDIAAHALQSRMQSFLGDVSRARTQTANVEAMLKRGSRGTMAVSFLDLANALIAWAQADTFLADGNAIAGERALRRAQQRALADSKIAADRERSIELAPAQDVTWQLLDLIQTQLVRLHLKQGRMQEAEIEAREMISRNAARFGRSSSSTAIALAALADVLAAQGRYAEAGALADSAMQSLIAAGAKTSSGFAFYAQRISIDAEIGRMDWKGAVDRIDRLRATLKSDAFMLQSTERQPSWALALLRTGRVDEAVDWLSRFVIEQERHLGANRYETAESRGLLGAALAARGDHVKAFEAFAAAIPVLVARRRGAEANTEDALRRQRRRAILEAYIGLLHQSQSERGTEAAAEAFRYGDAALGGTVQAALAASAARAMASTPQLGELIRGEQDAKREIASLRDRLLQLSTAAESEQRDKAVVDIRQRINEVELRRTDLYQRIESGFPDYANLVSPQPATLDEAQKSLRADEAMVLIVPGETQTFVWVVPHVGPVVFRAAALPAHELAALVRLLRLTLDPGDIAIEQLRGFDYATAHRLYAELLQPAESAWRNAKTLVVAADGALGQLPLSLLLTQRVQSAPVTQGSLPFAEMKALPWLARKVAVANVPSVNTFVRLRTLPQASALRTAFAGFGDPQFSRTGQALPQAGGTRLRSANIPRWPNTIDLTRQAINHASYADLSPLPDTREEVQSIARVLGANVQTDVYLGAQASRRTVRSLDLTQRRVVAFATHGLVAGDLPGLTQPALALSATDDPAESPLLTLEDVLGLKLNADWVVLSACNTAAGDGAGAEAVSGLGRGFFYAGSRALLLTHWPVETVSARLLVTEIFERYARNPDISRAQALNEAMLAVIDSPGTSEYSYAHPLFWAAYAIFGDGGR